MNTSLEINFLQQLVDEQIDVHVFLVSGIKLVGKIGQFDERCVLLRNTISQVIYKTAISTVVPQSQIDFAKL